MMTKIMVAEDNTVDYSCYQSYFANDETVNFVGHAQDGETAVEMYKEQKPDLLFLDLSLPKKNGLEVLDELTAYENGNNKCNVIIVTGDVNLKNDLTNAQKVYRILSKPTDYKQIKSLVTDFKIEQRYNEFPYAECKNILLQLCINSYYKTGRILIDIIKLCYCDSNEIESLNNIYHIIARKYECSPQKIEASLRSSINTINRFSNNKILNKIFYLENEKNIFISPKRFIDGFVNYLSNLK